MKTEALRQAEGNYIACRFVRRITLLSSIVVSQTELAEAFKSLHKFIKRHQDAEAVFTFTEDALTIDVPGIKTKVSGVGSLTRWAYVLWDYLYCVAAVPPTDDPCIGSS